MSKIDEMNDRSPGAAPVSGNGAGGGPDEPGQDLASQSISSALRTSFLALKIVLILLVVFYLGSGYFTVAPGQRAVVIQFGQIRGMDSEAGPVLEPGAHWMWPWPVSENVIESTEKSRTQRVAFWFYLPPGYENRSIEELKKNAPEALVPGRDNYLLSGQQEIVHLICAVRYRISNLVDYVNNVTDEPGLIQTVGEWASSQTVATMTTDAIVRGEGDRLRESVRRLMQQRLDEVRTGLEVVDIILERREVPLQVHNAYLHVVQAENEKLKLVSSARSRATQVLNNAAGPAYDPLKEAIQAYELARATGETAAAQQQMETILSLIDNAGGEVSFAIGQAMAERSRQELTVRAEVNRFQSLYEKYKQNPEVFLAQLWSDTKQEIMDSPDIEVIYLPYASKELRLKLDHNPQFLKNRERRQYTDQLN